MEELAGQLELWRPDVVIVDATLGEEGVALVKDALTTARVIATGPLPHADAVAPSLEAVRQAVLSLPPPAGPVRGPGPAGERPHGDFV